MIRTALESIASIVWRAMDRLNQIFGKLPRLWASVFVILLICLHGFIAHNSAESAGAVLHSGHSGWQFDGPLAKAMMAAAVLFLFISWQLWGLRERLLRISATVSKSDGQFAHAALILFLSERKADQKHKPEQGGSLPTYADWDRQCASAKELMAKIPKLGNSSSPSDWIAPLAEVCDSKGPSGGWNWQQPLRVILHDLKKAASHPDAPLCEVHILMSPESAADYFRFEALITPFLLSWPLGAIKLSREEGSLDVNNITECARTIRSAILEREKEFHKRRICVDATAGSKPFSIAVALATLNREMAFSYVDNGGTANFFDTNVSGIETGMD
jgi:hypothetical protein